MSDNKVCGTCKWHKYGDISRTWICTNKDSEKAAEETHYTASCESWNKKTEVYKEKARLTMQESCFLEQGITQC